MNILVSGSLAYDRILNFNDRFANHIIPDKIHTLSVSFIVDSIKESFGGTAGNIAYSLSLLGENPRIISTAGGDFGNYAVWLKKCGIATDSIAIAAGEQTAFATIMTDLDDNQITAFYPGAMTIPYHAAPVAEGAEIAIVAPGNMSDMRDFAAFYRAQNIPFIYDPGQQITVLSAEDLKNGMEGAVAFISNDYEFSLAAQKTGRSEHSILEHVSMIVTTLGSEGSRITTKEGVTEVGTANPAVVDPTGAGDAFRAGFLAGLRRKLSPRAAVQLGSTVAAYAIEVKGTQTHTFTKDALAARYRENYHEEIEL